MKRLTPEEVVKQYQDKDCLAKRGSFLITVSEVEDHLDANGIEGVSAKACGCIIGVCFSKKEEISKYPASYVEMETRAIYQGYDREYINGIEGGFDSLESATPPPVDYFNPVYIDGWHDGRAAFQALKKEGLVCTIFD